MNLNKYTKQAIVSSILAELPRVDYAAAKKEIQEKIVVAMSPECQAIFAKSPRALARGYTSEQIFKDEYRTEFILGDITRVELDAISKPYTDAHQDREAIRQKLEAAIEPLRTRKQFVDRFPEFSQHAPPEHGKCTTLPAVANIVADMIKLGWEPKVTKASHAEV